MNFEVYADKSGKSRWRLVSSNGQTIASSGEAFASAANAKKAAKSFSSKAKSSNFEVYADKSGKYRWRAISSNGQNVGSGGAPYANQSNARRAAKNVQDKVGKATGP